MYHILTENRNPEQRDHSLTHIDKIERHEVILGKIQIPLAGTYRDDLSERVK